MTFDIARYEALLPEIVADLVCAELRARAPQKFSDLSASRVMESNDWRRDFALDSLDRMSLASACAEFFNVYDSGREDTLLGHANCTRWSEVIASAQRETTRNITFRSSGSTGGAKHFRHPAAWLQEEAEHWARTIREAGSKRIVAHVPLHHIYGYLWVALLCATSGVDFVRFPTETLRTPKFEPGDLLISTPHLLESMILRGIKLNAPELIAVTSTGRFTRCNATTARDQLSIGGIWEVYGSSETAGLGIRRTPGDHYAWLPYLKTSTDGNASVLSVTRDLLGTPVALPLPDLLLAEGEAHFRVGGRTDNVLKIRGHRIDLDALLNELRKAPGLADVSVRQMGEGSSVAIKAFLVGKDSLLPPEDLIAQTKHWLTERWQHVGYIEEWRVGDEVPTNAIGKRVDW